LEETVGNALPNDRPDFFISVGDIVTSKPESDFSFEHKSAFFDTENLRGIPVFMVRGQLDAHYIEWSEMVEASMD
jgi:predicted phosphodiesterase